MQLRKSKESDFAKSVKEETPPTWDLSSEYDSLSDPRFQHDLAEFRKLIEKMDSFNLKTEGWLNSSLEGHTPIAELDRQHITELQKSFDEREEARSMIWQLATYCRCLQSVNARDSDAQKMMSQLQDLGSLMDRHLTALEHWLKHCSEEMIEFYFEHNSTSAEVFRVRQIRKLAPYSLNVVQEQTIKSFEVSGLSAWGQLYNTLQAEMTCQIKEGDLERTVGLAEASQLLRSSQESMRQAAFKAQDDAWKQRELSCAHILNSMSGWRWADCHARSEKAPLDELTFSVHFSHIQRPTLDAMNSAVASFRPKIQDRLQIFAKALGKNKIDPWDMLAPSPLKERKFSFNEAIELVEASFRRIDPDMGDFVKMAREKNWIEGRVIATKTQGAYCTGFPKSRTPRIFMTFLGSFQDVFTLAHELGHGYHSWVMRDLPRCQKSTPMTLAETASVFSEQALADGLSEIYKGHDIEKDLAWHSYVEALSFLVNIPMRYDFEKQLYQRRKVSGLSAKDLNELMDKCWMDWHGPHMSQPFTRFWCSKLHFYLPHISFYNYPYTFGYLFSLSIFATREKFGQGFFKAYQNLLLDTGRQTAEGLMQDHLGVDISSQQFWDSALGLIDARLNEFSKAFG
mgnify:CR=1 FL=1